MGNTSFHPPSQNLKAPEHGIFINSGKDAEHTGPLALSQLKSMYSDHQVNKATFVWFDPLESWVRLSDLAGFNGEKAPAENSPEENVQKVAFTSLDEDEESEEIVKESSETTKEEVSSVSSTVVEPTQGATITDYDELTAPAAEPDTKKSKFGWLAFWKKGKKKAQKTEPTKKKEPSEESDPLYGEASGKTKTPGKKKFKKKGKSAVLLTINLFILLCLIVAMVYLKPILPEIWENVIAPDKLMETIMTTYEDLMG